MTTVAVALSGGVDSSFAAWKLVKAGFNCRAVFMRTHPCEGEFLTCGEQVCAESARRVAEQLKIPFQILDVTREFRPAVEDYFVSEYLAGRTPNPCPRCNRLIKFGLMAEKMFADGADFFATGHYVRIAREGPDFRLLRGADHGKDQSYFLFNLRREVLSRLRFPIGEMTKDAVRRAVRAAGLPTHSRPESQEVCFVPNDDHLAYLRHRAPEAFRPGPIVDMSGKHIGEHPGIAGFTVGQRRGLRVAVGVPIYVARIDAKTNTLVAGYREDLLARHLTAENVNWLIDTPTSPIHAEVQIRYRHRAAPARIIPQADHCARVEFDEPVWAVTPGQAAVFYHDDHLLGGGWIASPSTVSEISDH